MVPKIPRRRVTSRVLALLGLTVLFVGLPVPVTAFESVADAFEIGIPEMKPSDGSELATVDDGHEFDTGHRLRGRADRVARFSMIGVSLTERPEEPVLIRVRETDGGWSEWIELPVNDVEGPDDNSAEGRAAAAVDGFRTEPVWVADADGYELSVAEPDADGSNVIVVRESTRRVIVDATPMASGDYPAFAGLHPRSDWGARARRNPGTAPASKVEFGVVHHSVSSNSYSAAQVPGQLRSTQAYHMDGNGWDDIGYNFVVDRFGGIWEGRAGSIAGAAIGAHAGGFNSGSVGVMVLGDYTSTQASAAAKESVAKVIGWKLSQFGTPATGTTTQTSAGNAKYAAGTKITIPRVVGHRDVGATACPGTIHGQLGSIRARTADWVAWFNATMKPVGGIDSVSAGAGTASMTGWAIDRTAPGAAWIRASVAGVTRSFYTSLSRPDIVAQHGGDGKAGFVASFTDVPPGIQWLCATVKGVNGIDTRLGCQTVLVADPFGHSPVGRFDYAVGTAGRISVAGWALDPTSSSAVSIALEVDGVARAWGTAGGQSRSVPATYSGSHGQNRQFTATAVAVPAGDHQVCVRATNIGPDQGQDTLVDCAVVKVPSHSPGGVVESVASGRPRKVDLVGWALDLEYTRPVDVKVTVGGRSYVVRADRRRDDIAAAYPGYGPNHGFAISVTADGGRQPYCVQALNIGAGVDKTLACGTVDVVK